MVAGLTSRFTRSGYTARAMALVGVGSAVGLVCLAVLMYLFFLLIGGKLPARAVLPVQWGGGVLALAVGVLAVDLLKRTHELVTTR